MAVSEASLGEHVQEHGLYLNKGKMDATERI